MPKRKPFLVTIDPIYLDKLKAIQRANKDSSAGKAIERLIDNDNSDKLENLYIKIDKLIFISEFLTKKVDKIEENFKSFIYKTWQKEKKGRGPGKKRTLADNADKLKDANQTNES